MNKEEIENELFELIITMFEDVSYPKYLRDFDDYSKNTIKLFERDFERDFQKKYKIEFIITALKIYDQIIKNDIIVHKNAKKLISFLLNYDIENK